MDPIIQYQDFRLEIEYVDILIGKCVWNGVKVDGFEGANGSNGTNIFCF